MKTIAPKFRIFKNLSIFQFGLKIFEFFSCTLKLIHFFSSSRPRSMVTLFVYIAFYVIICVKSYPTEEVSCYKVPQGSLDLMQGVE